MEHKDAPILSLDDPDVWTWGMREIVSYIIGISRKQYSPDWRQAGVDTVCNRILLACIIPTDGKGVYAVRHSDPGASMPFKVPFHHAGYEISISDIFSALGWLIANADVSTEPQESSYYLQRLLLYTKLCFVLCQHLRTPHEKKQHQWVGATVTQMIWTVQHDEKAQVVVLLGAESSIDEPYVKPPNSDPDPKPPKQDRKNWPARSPMRYTKWRRLGHCISTLEGMTACLRAHHQELLGCALVVDPGLFARPKPPNIKHVVSDRLLMTSPCDKWDTHKCGQCDQSIDKRAEWHFDCYRCATPFCSEECAESAMVNHQDIQCPPYKHKTFPRSSATGSAPFAVPALNLDPPEHQDAGCCIIM